MQATARRYSANSHDADDAYQRAAEILLTHSPTGTEDELCRWLRTTVKHEALAIRRQVERMAPAGEPALLPEPHGARRETAHDEAERSERLSMGAQALRRLKPQEIRCLVLRAEGYSYQEIGERTGFSYTKVNRCLTEGRRSFLARVESIESGAECDRLASRLSALADGEGSAEDLAAVRPHLETCLACRARLREFRAVPARVAALAPAGALMAGGGVGPVRSLFESLVGSTQHGRGAGRPRPPDGRDRRRPEGRRRRASLRGGAGRSGGPAATPPNASHPTPPIARPRRPTSGPPLRQVPAPDADLAPPPPDPAPPSPTAAPTPAAPVSPPVAPAPRPAREFAPEAAPAAAPCARPRARPGARAGRLRVRRRLRGWRRRPVGQRRVRALAGRDTG